MKKLIVILGLLITLVAGIFIGLSINNMVRNKKNNLYNNSNTKVDNEIIGTTNIEKSEEKVIEAKVETNNKENTKKEETKETVVKLSDKDKSVIDTLSNTLNDIKNSEVTEDFKSGAKKTFIDIVDFLFYNGTIKGVTFDELTETGKTKALELANKIDEAIEAKVPNYKETISDKATNAFKAVSSLIKKGSSNLNDFLKEKLTEEHYNAIVDSKEDLANYSKSAISFIKDNGSKLLNTAKDKLSAWYNKYKNS